MATISAGEIQPMPMHTSHTRTGATIQSQGRIAALDVWRGIACLLVFSFHTGASLRWPPLAIYGCTGVLLFFALSGYLLFQPFARSIARGDAFPSIPRFYARRFIRIYPPYLAALLVFVALRYATHTGAPTAGSILLHASLLFNYTRGVNYFSINPVFWSLAIEMQFYLLLPLICWPFGRLRMGPARALLLLVFSAIGLGLFSRSAEVLSGWNSDVQYRWATSYLDLFGYGMLVAYWLQCRPSGLVFRMRWIFALLGVALFFAGNDWCHFATGGQLLEGGSHAYAIVCPALLGLGSALVLYAVLAARLDPTPFLLGTLLAWVGDISYSLYLYHVGVQFAIFKFIPLGNLSYNAKSILYAVICLGPTLAVAWVMYRLIEKPAMAFAARRRARSAPARTLRSKMAARISRILKTTDSFVAPLSTCPGMESGSQNFAQQETSA